MLLHLKVPKSSIRPFMAEDNRNGAPEEHEIQPDAPVMHVPAVHLYALGVVDVAASAGLPHAGDAGQDHAVLTEVVAVALDLFGDDRARADEAHVALDDVP